MEVFFFTPPLLPWFSIAFKLAALVTSELSLKIVISNVTRVLYSTCKFVFFCAAGIYYQKEWYEDKEIMKQTMPSSKLDAMATDPAHTEL